MVNITPATAEATTAQTADAYAAQAAKRPLAGFGAGAFTREGARVGSRVNEMAAALALPRTKSAFAASSTGHAQAGVAGTAHMTSFIGIVQLSTAQVDPNNCIQMTRLYPVIPGGVGPHPAREPVPV
ncbi:MAG TPA: hypothetical protein VGI66_11425 [Streptosporangiaceae bacterium]|jgi:hypothetical protein